MLTRNVIAKVPVGQGPTGVAIHVMTNTAIVTNSNITTKQRDAGLQGSISIINLSTREVTEVGVGANAFGVGLDSDNQKAIVADLKIETGFFNPFK